MLSELKQKLSIFAKQECLLPHPTYLLLYKYLSDFIVAVIIQYGSVFKKCRSFQV